MPEVSHGLGYPHGSIIENTDAGTVSYRPTGKLLPVFTIPLSDVTGVTTKKVGLITMEVTIHGQGTVLAQAEVGFGTHERIAKWFQERVGSGAVRVAPAVGSANISDEIARLSALHEAGVLTAEEFAAAKRRLVGLP